jgi:hypothetical protein
MPYKGLRPSKQSIQSHLLLLKHDYMFRSEQTITKRSKLGKLYCVLYLHFISS